jgi:EAL domain-containing protein (putative c-di-GMP-specific phosphodiesterase class I)
LRSARGVIGVVGIGCHEAATAPALVEHMPALAAFASILGALLVPKLQDRRREGAQRAQIQGVLDASAFTPFFQPIVDLHTGAVVGYEALSRFTDGVPPDIRFAAAARAGSGIELELATLRAAITTAAAVLSPTAYLSLNASPELITSGALRALFAGLTRPLVVEITEHVAIVDYVALRAELAALGPTVRVAVDDAGAGYASFHHILELAPDLVKLDLGLIRGIDGDPARQALLAGMAYFAVKRKIRLVAEGIETREELEILRSLAIHYGQGYLLGRPQDGRAPGPWPMMVTLETRPAKARTTRARRSRPTGATARD